MGKATVKTNYYAVAEKPNGTLIVLEKLDQQFTKGEQLITKPDFIEKHPEAKGLPLRVAAIREVPASILDVPECTVCKACGQEIKPEKNPAPVYSKYDESVGIFSSVQTTCCDETAEDESDAKEAEEVLADEGEDCKPWEEVRKDLDNSTDDQEETETETSPKEYADTETGEIPFEPDQEEQDKPESKPAPATPDREASIPIPRPGKASPPPPPSGKKYNFPGSGK